MTTLALISIGLYHLSVKHKLPDNIVDSLKNSIVGNTEFGTTCWMGFKDRKAALEDLLTNNLEWKHDHTNISEKNIQENYRIIYNTLDNKFKTSHLLQRFIAYLRHRIFLIEIEIDKDKDVAMVFEVINDRGVPLKPYEILKGKILSQIDINDREEFIATWETEIQKIEAYGEDEIDNFFGFYFRSKYAESSDHYNALDKTRYHKTIFTEEFDTKVGLKNNERNARAFVKETMPHFIGIYTTLLEYRKSYNKDYEFAYFNGLNDMDGQFVLTLSAININDAEKNEKIKLIPKYFDKFFVLSNLTCSYKSNEFNTNIVSLNSLIRGKSVESVKGSFDRQLLTLIEKNHERQNLEEPFKYEFFKNAGYNDLGKTFLRYFFARIDHFISDSSDLNEYATYRQLV